MRWTGKRDEISSDPKLKGHGVYVFVVWKVGFVVDLGMAFVDD